MTYLHRLTAACLAWAVLCAPVFADVKAEVGSTTMAAGNEINLSGAFQPKALVTWGTFAASNPAGRAMLSVGMADGASQARVTIVSMDNQADSDTARGYSTTDLYNIYTAAAPTTWATASLSSLDADGFTLSKSGPGAADASTQLSYLALGGSDLTHAKIVTVNGAAASGSQATTGVGFKPDAVIFLTCASGGAGANAYISYGFATADAQYAIGGYSQDAQATTVTRRVVSNTKVVAIHTTSVFHSAALTSLDADGFTLNWTTVGNTTPVACLCLKFTSPSYVKAGHVTTGTANGQTITASGLGHTPKGVLLMGVGASTFDTVTTSIYGGVGAFDDTRQASVAVHDLDNAATSTAKSYFYTNRAHVIADGTQAVDGLNSPAVSAGQFTATATKIDTSARLVPYLSFGQPAGGGGQGVGPAIQSSDFLLLLSELDRLKGRDRLYAASEPSYALAP